VSIPRNLSVIRIAADLGLKLGKDRRWGPCPACGDDSKRPPIYLHHNNTGWTCSRCSAAGDAVDLISFALVGTKGRDAGSRFGEVIAWLKERGEVTIEPVVHQPRAEPVRPPALTLSEMLKQCTPAWEHDAARAYLEGRGFTHPVPAGVVPPWFSAPWWPRFFTRHWPLVVPAYTGHGVLGGLHGKAISGNAPRKSTWPREVESIGLFFADPVLARPMLWGKASPAVVVIAEGITDYLWACHEMSGQAAVIGIESGSIDALAHVAFPPDCEIFIGTDPDGAGDEYATKIALTLSPRPCLRLPLHRLRAA